MGFVMTEFAAGVWLGTEEGGAGTDPEAAAAGVVEPGPDNNPLLLAGG